MLDLLTVICGLAFWGFCVWTTYCAWFFRKGLGHRQDAGGDFPPVSVIIPARNEAANLGNCLASVLAQDYPGQQMEIWVVDDHSSDNTRVIAESFSPRVGVIGLDHPGDRSGKKAALEAGIRQARGVIILQTDADCRVGPGWCRAMVNALKEETGLVAGPVLSQPGKRWHESIQALELVGLVAMAGGGIRAGFPVMSNGANLAFRKKTFEQCGGYSGIEGIASGDDEFFMQKVFQHPDWKVGFAFDQAATVQTQTIAGWRDLIQQRLRWVGKSRHYLVWQINALQIMAYLGFWVFPLLLFRGIWNREWLVFLGMAIAVKLIADLFLMVPALRFFSKLPWIKWLPLLELVYVPYVLWIGLAGNLRRRVTWKGRSVQ